MAMVRAPALHDTVLWRGARWLVTRVMYRGRLELTTIVPPTVQALCLAEQLTWVASANVWVLTQSSTSTRG